MQYLQLAFAASLVFINPTTASAINKCAIDGKTAYQEAPCPEAAQDVQNIDIKGHNPSIVPGSHIKAQQQMQQQISEGNAFYANEAAKRNQREAQRQRQLNEEARIVAKQQEYLDKAAYYRAKERDKRRKGKNSDYDRSMAELYEGKAETVQ